MGTQGISIHAAATSVWRAWTWKHARQSKEPIPKRAPVTSSTGTALDNSTRLASSAIGTQSNEYSIERVAGQRSSRTYSSCTRHTESAQTSRPGTKASGFSARRISPEVASEAAAKETGAPGGRIRWSRKAA